MMKIRLRTRSAVAALLYHAGLTKPAHRARAKLSIATFHRVLPEEQRREYPYPNLVVTPEELDQLLSFLGDHYDCGPLEAQHARYVSQERTQRPLLAVTFDDGQYDNFVYARPILARHRIKSTFFIPVRAVQTQDLLWHDQLGFAVGRDAAYRLAQELKRLPLTVRLEKLASVVAAAGASKPPAFARMMTFAEVAALANEGHEIGSHSMTHCLMPECGDRDLLYEVGESRAVLRAHTGQAIESFCYPNGDADNRSAVAVASAGYRRAVTTRWGRNDLSDDAFLLRRFDVDAARIGDARGRMAPAQIALRLSGFRWRQI